MYVETLTSSDQRNATSLSRSCNFSKVIDFSVGMAKTLLVICDVVVMNSSCLDINQHHLVPLGQFCDSGTVYKCCDLIT